ncbi:hypothetical protein ACHAWT_000622 [Skeletonema menzelii]
MRSSSLAAVLPLLILLHRQPVTVAAAEEEQQDGDGLFISKVDRSQHDDDEHHHLTPPIDDDLPSVNPFDVAQTRHYSSGKSKSAKAVYVGALYFGYGSSKSAKTSEVVVATTTTTTTTTPMAKAVRPTLPHNIIQPPPPNYNYYSNQQQQQQYYYNSKPGKGSKSGKSGKAGSKSGKYQQQQQYYYTYSQGDQWGRPVSPTPPPPKVTTTTATTTTSATATTTVAASTTDIEATTTESTMTSASTTSSSTISTTTNAEESSSSTIIPAQTTSSSSYQCFTERNELLSAVDRYIQGDCGTEEAKEYFICQDVLATYGWPIGSWCIGPTVNSLSRVFMNRKTFNEDISGWQVGNVTDMWGMFLGATTFNQDLSTWDISSVIDMKSMFMGATSFQQDLCAWGDQKFPYENAADIFLNTNCTYQNVPALEQGGPFCASSCGAVIVTSTMATATTTTMVTTTVPEITTTSEATATTTIPETTTSSGSEVESPTPYPTYSPTLSEQPTALPSMMDVQETETSTSTTSTAVPETTTSKATTTREEATTEATEAGTTATAADATTSSATVSTVQSTAAASEGGTEASPLIVTLTYDISNECGLDAEKVMNGVDNSLKEGLIAATTTILQQTLLNEATTRSFDGIQRFRMIPPGFRGSVVTPQRYKMNLPDGRALATYSDEYPVTIDRVIDVEQSCEPGTNCLLIISSVNVVLDEGDDPNEVKNVITDSILNSFDDGRFNDAVPADTVVCPITETPASIESCARLDPNPYSFEPPNNVFPKAPWTTGGDGEWTIDDTNAIGSYSIKSPNLEGSEGAAFSNATLAICDDFNGGVLNFNTLAPVLPPYDVLVWFVDGVEISRIAGSPEWMAISIPLTPGAHQIDFQYQYNPFDLPVLPPDLPEGRQGAVWIDTVELVGNYD